MYHPPGNEPLPDVRDEEEKADVARILSDFGNFWRSETPADKHFSPRKPASWCYGTQPRAHQITSRMISSARKRRSQSCKRKPKKKLSDSCPLQIQRPRRSAF